MTNRSHFIRSKSFGGKIKTDVSNKSILLFKKNWRMRILSARTFSKFFGGKIENI